MEPIYLDHNSTTPIDPRVAAEMLRCFEAGYVNPASQHRPGQAARRVLERHRSRILEILGGSHGGTETDRLIFTSGGTESNNLALRGLIDPQAPPARILVSAMEHPSVLDAAQFLVQQGHRVEWIPVDSHGQIRLDALAAQLSEPVALVSVMLANNETGVIQPLAEVVRLARAAGALVHTDAVQAVAKIPVNFRELGVDALTFTGHKFHGPRGIGGLLLRGQLAPAPLLGGGFQQAGIRPGTEDVALVAGLAAALEIFVESGAIATARMAAQRDRLQEQIQSSFPDTVIHGRGPESADGAPWRVPHTLNLSVPGVNRQEFLMAADLRGLAISTGSACASGSSEPSHVLLAMGLPEELVEGSIRISLGIHTTDLEIDRAASHIISLINDLRR